MVPLIHPLLSLFLGCFVDILTFLCIRFFYAGIYNNLNFPPGNLHSAQRDTVRDFGGAEVPVYLKNPVHSMRDRLPAGDSPET